MTALEPRIMLDASLPVLTGQVLWLDAADSATIFDADGDNAATGTGGNNDGFSGFVATWVDKSASGFDVTASGSLEPQYGVNTLNGSGTVTFDGTNDRLTNTTASITGNNITAFVVYKKDSVAGREAVYELGAGGSRNGLFMSNTAGHYDYYVSGAFSSSTAISTPAQYDLFSMTQGGTALKFWIDGALDTTATTLNRVATTGIFVGDDSTSNDWLQGDIAELIVYNRVLANDERHDVETYLAGKWGLTIANTNPTIDVNTTLTLDEGTNAAISITSSDADNSDTNLTYTITSLAGNGTIYNTMSLTTLGSGDHFTQAQLTAGTIEYRHDGTNTTTDSFGFTVSDGLASVSGTYSISITPVNDAPVFSGWTLVSSEDFEGGATGWSDNTTTAGGSILTTYLGRHSMESGNQDTYKTYTLSGTQDHVTIALDFYRIDSWDNENFIIFIDDTPLYVSAFQQNTYYTPADGTNGNTSWMIQETTPFLTNFVHGSWNDQTFHYELKVQTNATSLKLGFSSTLNQAVSDEAWGVDNINIYEVSDGGTPGPFSVSEIATNGSVFGEVVATDPDPSDTLTYSITGGTGAGIFAINPSTGKLTVINAAMLDYETTPSYTLDIVVTDNGTPAKTDTATITINLLDAPENTAPVLAPLGPLNVDENSAVNTVLGTASATDAEGNAITYTISAGNSSGLFTINSSTGVIRLIGVPDYEQGTSYTLTIRAQDNGFGNLATTRNVVININDVNEAPSLDPVQGLLWSNPSARYFAGSGNFYLYSSTTANWATASSNATANMLNGVAGYLAIPDSSAENNFIKSIITAASWLGGSDTSIEGTWIWTAGPDAGQTFWIGNVAGSAQNGYYTNWASTEPNDSGNEDGLQMLTNGSWNDANISSAYRYVTEWDGASVLATMPALTLSMPENSPLNSSVGYAVAYDQDTADTKTYSLTGGTGVGIFALNATTGEITLTNPAAINYEVTTSYTLNIQVTDSGGLTDSTTFTINITDANDTPTDMSISAASVMENSAIGTLVGIMSSTDEDSADTHTYSLLTNPGHKFTIVGDQLQVSGSIDYEATQNITLRIRTDDGHGGIYDKNIVIHIGDEADTYTPPPSSGGSGSVAPNSFATGEDLSGKGSGNIIHGSIRGESVQQAEFYGSGSIFQIVREFTTFRIKSLIEKMGNGTSSSGEDFAQSDDEPENIRHPAPATEYGYTAIGQHYTNIRELLNHIQPYEDQDSIKHLAHQSPETDTQKSPFHMLDREFVDVLTYHEQKQAALRKALLS